jgi:lysine 2,3-aminomutase
LKAWQQGGIIFKEKGMKRRYDNKSWERLGWKRILMDSVTSPAELPQGVAPSKDLLGDVTGIFPMRINPYYLSLVETEGDPIYRQCVPDQQELSEEGLEDPLGEEVNSPVPGLTHRYPDRCLFLVSNRCAVYCRFCNRRRKVGKAGVVTAETIREGIAYIRGRSEIRDVLLSGGDPFLLEDSELFQILSSLRSIPHVEIIRIGTRIPCTLPQRVTRKMALMLKSFHPLYVNTHFNHPREITPQAALACSRLAEAGIPVGCQTVLLKGVNDDPATMRSLMHGLLRMRVRPYYLFQADLARGTAHFWTDIGCGLELMRSLQGYTSGLCLPHFAVDLPSGGGKVPLLPDYIEEKKEDGFVFRTFEGRRVFYPARQRKEI